MSVAIWGKYLSARLQFQRVRRCRKDTCDNLFAISLRPALGNYNHQAHRPCEGALTSPAILQPKLFPAARQVINIFHMLWTSSRAALSSKS